jgi:hypothetical protein
VAKRARLATYTGLDGRQRELLARPGRAGTRLVIDRDAESRSDPRLVAQLGADEPPENAAIISRLYLADTDGRGRCRPLRSHELHPQLASAADTLVPENGRVAAETGPLAPGHPPSAHREGLGRCILGDELRRADRTFRLEMVAGAMSIPELRWIELPGSCLRSEGSCVQPVGSGVQSDGSCARDESRRRAVSLRQVVAELEAYEPACHLTERALRDHGAHREVSATTLRLELDRVRDSPIVLNRRLRETVMAAVSSGRLSMSEIAMRCGRVKRDPNGNESGETSWLARRLGLLAESGGGAPTPWIHSDVLAVIARQGLGVAPREVEL